MNYYLYVLVGVFLLCVQANGETLQPFKVGVGVDSDDAASASCTDSEMEFMRNTIKKYTVGLARLFFRDPTLELVGEFTAIDHNAFSSLAFEDFNAYEVGKFADGSGEVIDTTGTLSPSTSQAPSSSPITIATPATGLRSGSYDSNAPVTAVANVAPTLSPVCEENCVMLDFSTYPDGSPVQRGDYVSDEWEESLGVRVFLSNTNSAAYTPLKEGTTYKQARIFDTSTPVTETDGDKDLGSPNQHCPGGGPGIGAAGEVGMPGENCVALGNALIIQEGDKATPDDQPNGGTFTFEFTDPVEFKSIGVLDVARQNAKITVFTIDENGNDQVDNVYFDGLGNNAAQVINVPYSNVTKIQLVLPSSVGVTFLNYCLPGCANGDTASGSRLLQGELWSATTTNKDSTTMTSYDSEVPVSERKLFNGYKYVYGGNSQWGCRFCGGDSVDNRRRLQSRYFISALESVLSFGLTADMSWNYKTFLEEQNLEIGCLGDGNSLRVVFELAATAAIE